MKTELAKSHAFYQGLYNEQLKRKIITNTQTYRKYLLKIPYYTYFKGEGKKKK